MNCVHYSVSVINGQAWTTRGLAVLACLICVLPISAEDSPTADSADLRSLRSQFRKNLIETILLEKKAHLGRLGELEKKLATAHNFANAIRARDERVALEQEITALDQELPMLTARAAGEGKVLPERIAMKLDEATLTGVKLDKDGALTGWSDTASAAAWLLPGLPPGGYEIIIKYSCGKDEGGAVIVKESFYSLRGAVAPTGDKPMEKNIGTLRVRDGHGILILAANAPPKGGLMRLWSLELAPVSR